MKSTVARITDHLTRRPAAERLDLPDGASARIVNDALELRDRAGALLVRYLDGHAEVYAPRGDLTLAAPHGRVVVQAGTELRLDAGERVALSAPRGDFELDSATLVAGDVATRVRNVTQQVERYQLIAGRLIEQAQDAFRDVSGVLQSRLGRARTIVTGEHSLHARRTVMVSSEETSIDGKRILLG